MALGAGSIAFSGFNADGTDNLAFVALETIPTGTVIYFRDDEWNGTAFADEAESSFSWTATADVAAGTVVRIDAISGATTTTNIGSVAYVNQTNTGYSNGGETVYAYLGSSATTPTTFLAAVASNGFSATTGLLDGTGLVVGQTALELTGGIDIAGYSGPRSGVASFADYRALLNSPANFTIQDGSGDQSIDGTTPDAPFPTDAFIVGGVETQTVGFTAPTVSLSEGNGGTTSFTFTVARTGGTTGAISFSGTVALGTTDAADFAGGTAPATFSGTIAAGALDATVTIAVAGDTLVEANEAFTLTLTSATNAANVATTVAPGGAIAAGTITNDDVAAPLLGPGSIAFVGFNADGNDDIAFVVLNTIEAGQTIYFSDREWQGTAFNTGEGEVAWTAASRVAAGTVVTISSFGSTPVASTGTVTGSSGLGASDEIVYAFVGAPNTPSAFLAAVANGGFAVDGGTLNGTGLVVGQTAIDLAPLGGSPDVAAFSGARGNQASYADYAAVINNSANWVAQDGTGDQSTDGTAPDVPFARTAFTLNAPTLGGITVYDAAPSLAGAVNTPTATDDIVLVRVGSYAGTGPTAAARAESVSYDATTARLFVTNAVQSLIDVSQLNADGSTTALAPINLAGLPGYGGVNSVAVANGLVAVAYQNSAADQAGYVALFDAATGTLQRTIQVGVLPDQVTFSPDGSRILVANEGETVTPTNNPAGSVTIIDVSGGAAAAAITNTIGFGALSGFETTLAARGLALFGGQAAGNDIEPEYISVSPDGTRAYVTLQEVNAVAVIDLTDPNATAPIAIQPLGGVDRNLAGNAFDPNDQDGIRLVNADVVSLLQPDALASWTVGGATYFVTANEGDARVGGLTDEVRLSSASYVLDPTAYPNAAAIKTNAELGRLNVLTNVGDTDGDGDYDQIYTFGGRSISIFRQEADGSITKVRETGGEFEAIIARDYAALFNSENGAGVDSRSDNKGPEPEGVTVGQIGDRFYAFVTLERVGGVMVYDVTDPANASFVSYRPATDQDFAPETVEFIAAGDNPTGGALVVSANEVSGTTTLYRVVQQNDADNIIVGSDQAEQFDGRGGNDTLTGGLGADRLTGGTGADTFRDTAAGLNGDTITDFTAEDRIVISNATLEGFSFTLTGNTLTFTGGSLTLQSVPQGGLVARAAAGGGVELVVAPVPISQAEDDYNGDGRSDILWRNDNGALSNWLGQASGGFAVNDANAFATVLTDWRIVGSADVNGDGRADILWRNADGRFSNWLANGNGGFTPNDANALVQVDNGWQVVGTGDFNGDGRDDALWRNADGRVSDWLANANGSLTGNDAAALRSVETSWQVAGTGDFNGDGRDDILWRNSDGRVSNWLGKADGGFTPNDGAALATVETFWAIAGTGDFNGDGYDDIFWRNDRGGFSEWLGKADGGFVLNDAAASGTVATSWQVVATGDYNGDGKDDLLWRNSDGALSDWLGTATGGFAINDANAFAKVETSWHVQPEPFAFG